MSEEIKEYASTFMFYISGAMIILVTLVTFTKWSMNMIDFRFLIAMFIINIVSSHFMKKYQS